MSTKVIIQANTFDRIDDVVYDTDDVLETLFIHFKGKLPDNARVYQTNVAQACDITPHDERGVEYIQSIDNDTIYVVVYPEFFLFGLGGGLLGTLLKIVLLGLLSYLLRPKPPKERNRGDQSPNNGLSERTNEARLNERIPDIYGTINSVPDLIQPTWYRFEANRQVTYDYLCIGRGEFDIDETTIKEDETPVQDISAVSVEVYGPGESPNKSNPTKQIAIGNAINERVWGVRQSSSITQQVLRPPDANEIDGDESIAFSFPDQIILNQSAEGFENTAMDDFFAVGDPLQISGSVSQGNTINFDGNYEVASVTSGQITLVRPELVNSAWSDNGNFATDFTDANLTTDEDKWVGPFTVERSWVICSNFEAPQGMYITDEDGDQQYHQVEIEIEHWEVDDNGDQIGPTYSYRRFIEGSRTLTNARNESCFCEIAEEDGKTPSQASETSWQVRARRVTPRGDSDNDQYVEQVVWDSLFSLEYIEEDEFLDTTTVFTRTPATSTTIGISERRLNMMVTRKIIGRSDANIDEDNPYGFTDSVVPVTSAGLIIRDIALDPYLGNMSEDELDYDSIFTAIAQNQQYFGTDLTRNIGITFDERDTSAEEMIQTIARACFCTAYRQGSQLKLNFERKTSVSSLIFNHRNKIPRSEVRTISFGTNDDHDGVEIEWINPEDGATETYAVPNDNATNPERIELLGVSSEVLAHMHAWREWNKIRYRNVAVEFEATSEAICIVQNDRILVADNTRSSTIDGEVTYQDGVEIGLSQPFEPEDDKDYVIYFQLSDGTVEMLEINLVVDTQTIILSVAPGLPLVTEQNKFAKTTYIITESTQVRPVAFLAQEIEPEDQYRVRVNAYNYDDRFYDQDTDFINGLVGQDTDDSIILAESFEDLTVSPGEFLFITNPGIFTSNGNGLSDNTKVVNTAPHVAADGDKYVELESGRSIYIDIPTMSGYEYSLLCQYSPRPYATLQENTIDIYWNGVFFHRLEDVSDFISWRNIFFDLPSPNNGTTRLEFISQSSTGRGGYMDDFKIRETRT